MNKCNVSNFMDTSRKLCEEILRKDNKSEMEKMFLYHFTLMTLEGLVFNGKPNKEECKDCGNHEPTIVDKSKH